MTLVGLVCEILLVLAEGKEGTRNSGKFFTNYKICEREVRCYK